MAEETKALQVEFKAQPGTITAEFFPRLTAWVEKVSAPYRNALVTEENLKQSEDDLKECRDTFTTLETERKNLKKLWNAPYEEWEKQYKEAVSGLTEAIENISGQVKAFKGAEKAAREEEVRKLIVSDINDIAGKQYVEVFLQPSVWNRIHKAEYDNKSYSRNKATLEWRQAITMISNDIKAIGDDEQLLTAYIDLGDLASATMKVKEDRARLERLSANAKPIAEELEVPPAPADVIVKEVPDESNVSEELRKVAAATRRYTGPKYKLYILFELADALGLTYEKTTK